MGCRPTSYLAIPLRFMARNYPVTEAEFSAITGVGATKLRNYGEPFLTEIQAHMRANPRQVFGDDPALVAPVAPEIQRGIAHRDCS